MSFDNIKFNNLVITYTAQVFFGIIFLDCSLMNEDIILCIVTVDETISVSDIEPLDGASDFFSYEFASRFV